MTLLVLVNTLTTESSTHPCLPRPTWILRDNVIEVQTEGKAAAPLLLTEPHQPRCPRRRERLTRQAVSTGSSVLVLQPTAHTRRLRRQSPGSLCPNWAPGGDAEAWLCLCEQHPPWDWPLPPTTPASYSCVCREGGHVRMWGPPELVTGVGARLLLRGGDHPTWLLLEE